MTGVKDAFAFPGFVPAYVRPLFCRGVGPFRWVALSGDPEDIYRTDAKVRELLPDDAHLHHWLDMARERIQFQGLPARICWVGLGDRHRLGLAFNEMVARGELKAPIVIGRDHLDSGSVASPNRETEAMRDGSDAVADWPLLNALLNTASGATWVSHPPRRRRRHGLLAARRRRHRLRRHAGGRAAHRAGAVERSGDRGHAPRRCRLRARHRVRARAGPEPAVPGRRALSAAEHMSGTLKLWRNARLATCDAERAHHRRRCAAHARRAHRVGGRGGAAARPQAGAEVHDLGGAWVTPGLIDCHTHLVFAGTRADEYAERLRGRSYEEIARAGGGILSTVRAVRAASEAAAVR